MNQEKWIERDGERVCVYERDVESLLASYAIIDGCVGGGGG